jgi:hypothetical protein
MLRWHQRESQSGYCPERMERTRKWWESLTYDQRAEVLALPPGPMPEWVIHTMTACDVPMVPATMDGHTVYLAPTITTDFIAIKRRDGAAGRNGNTPGRAK